MKGPTTLKDIVVKMMTTRVGVIVYYISMQNIDPKDKYRSNPFFKIGDSGKATLRTHTLLEG